MPPALSAILSVLVFFASMLAMLDAGRRRGQRRIAEDPEGGRTGTGSVDGAVFALFGLLIAFTFSGAATRFDARRGLIVQEANDIGTAWLRLEVLPAETQPALRELFRRYVDGRIATYKKTDDLAAVAVELARTSALQGEIWTLSVAAVRAMGNVPVGALLLNAENEMFDIVTTRAMIAKTHPPMVIFALLVGLSLICAFLAGFAMAGGKTRRWLHDISFASVIALTVYVTIDIEYPRRGLLRVDDFDQAIVDVRTSMK